MKIRRFCLEDKEKWDYFVNEVSINGTFLQSRKFLDYHPEGRFLDCSLVIEEKGNIVAVIPACIVDDNNHKVFYSHKGSTFGGIVLSSVVYTADSILAIIDILEDYLQVEGFDKVILKNTSDIFSIESNSLLEYCLYHKEYHEYQELSTYIDYSKYEDSIVSNFSQGKRTNYNNCVKMNIQCRGLEEEIEIQDFYKLLTNSLLKHNVKPVHSLSEILELRHSRLEKEVSIWGCFLDTDMVAGSMVFHFKKALCAHTQYLCADSNYNKLSPMTYLCYFLIKEMRDRGYQKLSWGISTEEYGKVINHGLLKTKEAYGSRYSINRIFYKSLIK